ARRRNSRLQTHQVGLRRLKAPSPCEGEGWGGVWSPRRRTSCFCRGSLNCRYGVFIHPLRNIPCRRIRTGAGSLKRASSGDNLLSAGQPTYSVEAKKKPRCPPGQRGRKRSELPHNPSQYSHRKPPAPYDCSRPSPKPGRNIGKAQNGTITPTAARTETSDTTA